MKISQRIKQRSKSTYFLKKSIQKRNDLSPGAHIAQKQLLFRKPLVLSSGAPGLGSVLFLEDSIPKIIDSEIMDILVGAAGRPTASQPACGIPEVTDFAKVKLTHLGNIAKTLVKHKIKKNKKHNSTNYPGD